MDKGKSQLSMAVDDLCLLSSEDGEDQGQQRHKVRSSTMLLLRASSQLLHVLDAIWPTLLVLRQDIQQNVKRLQDYRERDSFKYASLTVIVMEEVEEGTSRNTNSCTRAIMWLARSVSFSIQLLERVVKNPESTLKEMVEEAYESTLKPFHGWISSAAYKVALCLVPERDIFIQLLMGNCQDHEDLWEDVMILVSVVEPLLEEINATLVKHQLDRLKST